MSDARPAHRDLTRSRTDRMIGGVCAGLAKYFDLDPVTVRVIFVILALAQGAGLLLYLVLLIVMPEEPVEAASAPAVAAARPVPRHRGAWAGVLLVLLGAYLLVMNLGVLWWWDWKFGGPAILIIAGLLLLARRLR